MSEPRHDRTVPAIEVRRRADLHRAGLNRRQIAVAVESGELVRAREGSYLRPDDPIDARDAWHVGGRLACVSELARHGIFVLDTTALHVHLPANASRLRAVDRPVRTHWGELRDPPRPRVVSVSVFDALLQAVLCQTPRAAVATIDSALHIGALAHRDLDALFAALPKRFGVLRPLLDSRAEAGTESLVRLMLRALGLSFEVQVRIAGVGRVDFVVAGWLIIECDSRAHHSDWEAQRRDRRRDLAAAAAGFATLRLIAEDILWHPDQVRGAIAGVVSGAARAQNQETRRGGRRH